MTISSLIRDRIKKWNEQSYLYPLLITVVLLIIMFQFSFHQFDDVIYDFWIKTDLGINKSNNVVIVTLDDDSDNFLGESYPYTYSSHQKFIQKVINGGPALIGYLINLKEPENKTELEFQSIFKGSVNQFVKNGGKFRIGTDRDNFGEILPNENLRDLGFSFAGLHLDTNSFGKEKVCRRTILNFSGEDTFHLWMANQFRNFKSQKKIDFNQFLGSNYQRQVDATYSLFRYHSNPEGDYIKKNSIPFHRIVVGNFPTNFFKDKIVLVAPNYDYNSDYWVGTPFNKNKNPTAKINVHSIIIEALVQDKTIFEVSDKVTDIFSFILGIFVIYLVSRFQPAKGLLMTVSCILLVALVSYLSFSLIGVWFKIGHIVGTVFIVYYIWVPFRAIGEYQRRYAIQEETKILKQVDHLKQNFISLMSHDLKTPVAKIAGIADLLVNQYPNTPDQNKHLKSIVESTEDLNKFITSILDLTKIESKNLNLNRSSKDINKIIENIVVKLKFEASHKNIELVKNLGPLYPISIDADLMNRVISNLIENAIKYAGTGSKVEVKTYDDDKWVWVEIIDNGIGISPEDVNHIFEKFYRVKNDSTHRIKGTGLGLYLVKYFIELHQGEIFVQSKLGAGTSFKIKLKNA